MKKANTIRVFRDYVRSRTITVRIMQKTMIFACSLGLAVSFIALPQAVIFLTLFYLAKVIFPLTTDTMINDFKAVGGMILIGTSFRMLKLKDIPVADMIPSMIIAMPLSWLYTTYILPLLG